MTTYDTKRAAAFLFHTDVYKWAHKNLYTPGTTEIFSNYTNRGSRIPGVYQAVNFGLDGFIVDLYEEFREFLAGDIDEILEYFSNVYQQIMGSVPDTTHFRKLYEYGHDTHGLLPIEFYSLPQGDLVPMRVPNIVFRNTHPDFAWLPNYIETWLSASIWHPSTVATISRRFRALLDSYARETAGSTEGVDYQGHDFSFRGLEHRSAAAASGAAHLLSFNGSDTLEAINYINRVYPNTDVEKEHVMGSVIASEHSVMCIGSEVEGEFDTYKRILTDNPEGIISLVSDTYNLWAVLVRFLPKLKDLIMSRNGKLVIRPDSGDPVKILLGDPESDNRYARQGVLDLLWDTFGGTENELGYRVLDPHIGVIYGDSITYDSARNILDGMKYKGYASTNVVLAQGSFAFQYVTRDSLGSAVKATAAVVNGEEYQIFKDPITDNGTKKSARGYLKVVKVLGMYELIDGLTREEFEDSIEDGTNELKPYEYEFKSFTDIRDRVRNSL